MTDDHSNSAQAGAFAPASQSHEPDLDLLRQRYAAEREMRVRIGSAAAGYVELDAAFDKDPWVKGIEPRAPVRDEVEILIIGGGFGGMTLGARLRKRGLDDFRIIDKGGDFGGAWYWNRYPGCQCDIESYIYLPLLEETGFMPTEKYSYAPEIFDHCQRIARHFDLYRNALFSTFVNGCAWNEERRRWIVTTDRGDEIAARYVVKTTGVNDKPKLPQVKGIGKFKGRMFHSARWDYDYTGGDSSGGLDKLADKRVAVVGTGCTSLQVTPKVAEYAKHLYVVQRTPQVVGVRGNKPTDAEWYKALPPGWQKERRENFVLLTSGIRQDEDMVRDGWTDAVRRAGGFFQEMVKQGFEGAPEAFDEWLERADARLMNDIRARIDHFVPDHETAESLKPWYRLWCKRPGFHDDYLAAFARPNVTLLDTKGRGLTEMTGNSIIFEGRRVEVDLVVFCTGFEHGTSFGSRVGYETYGRGGMALSDTWAHGMRSLHGFYTHGFPNLFHMTASQNGVSYLRTYMIEEQAEHVAEVLLEAHRRRAEIVEPSKKAEEAWQVEINSRRGDLESYYALCTPSWANGEARSATGNNVLDNVYRGNPVEFYAMTARWRNEGFQGLEIKPAPDAAGA